LGQTPSQTAGPFFAYGLTPKQYGYPFASIATGQMADEAVAGERIRIIGQVLDGEGVGHRRCADRVVAGRRARALCTTLAARAGAIPGFCGFGRQGTGTDPENRFIFDTIKPGPVDAEQAPHISVIVFMRGLLTHAYTRMYFSDEAEANARDPVLNSVPQERRSDACRQAPGGRRGLPLRHPHAGRGRDGVFRRVRGCPTTAPPTPPGRAPRRGATRSP
jgi:protocatechuate 3,4-dioxygenase, alpha subunit